MDKAIIQLSHSEKIERKEVLRKEYLTITDHIAKLKFWYENKAGLQYPNSAIYDPLINQLMNERDRPYRLARESQKIGAVIFCTDHKIDEEIWRLEDLRRIEDEEKGIKMPDLRGTDEEKEVLNTFLSEKAKHDYKVSIDSWKELDTKRTYSKGDFLGDYQALSSQKRKEKLITLELEKVEDDIQKSSITLKNTIILEDGTSCILEKYLVNQALRKDIDFLSLARVNDLNQNKIISIAARELPLLQYKYFLEDLKEGEHITEPPNSNRINLFNQMPFDKVEEHFVQLTLNNKNGRPFLSKKHLELFLKVAIEENRSLKEKLKFDMFSGEMRTVQNVFYEFYFNSKSEYETTKRSSQSKYLGLLKSNFEGFSNLSSGNFSRYFEEKKRI